MTELFAQGLSLTLYGMGTVMVFLCLLILVTVCMSKIILSLEKGSALHGIGNTDKQELVPTSTTRLADTDSPHLRAVIAEAVRKYKSRHP